MPWDGINPSLIPEITPFYATGSAHEVSPTDVRAGNADVRFCFGQAHRCSSTFDTLLGQDPLADLVVNLAPVDWDGWRPAESELHSIASNLKNGYLNVVADAHPLTLLSAQN